MFILFLVPGVQPRGGRLDGGRFHGHPQFARRQALRIPTPRAPLSLLRGLVPAPKQTHQAHPIAQPGVPQAARADAPAPPQPAARRPRAPVLDGQPPGRPERGHGRGRRRRPHHGALPRRVPHGAGRVRRQQRRHLQVLRQVVPRRELPHRAPAGAHGRPPLQVRVLRQGLQAAPPHEGPLPGPHGGTALPLRPLRQDFLQVHHLKSSRENPLSKIRQEVPVPQQPRRGDRRVLAAID